MLASLSQNLVLTAPSFFVVYVCGPSELLYFIISSAVAAAAAAAAAAAVVATVLFKERVDPTVDLLPLRLAEHPQTPMVRPAA